MRDDNFRTILSSVYAILLLTVPTGITPTSTEPLFCSFSTTCLVGALQCHLSINVFSGSGFRCDTESCPSHLPGAVTSESQVTRIIGYNTNGPVARIVIDLLILMLCLSFRAS